MNNTNKVFVVIGGEENGGVRNYVLYFAEKLRNANFYIASGIDSFCPSFDNIIYFKAGSRFNEFNTIIELNKNHKIEIIANTISGGVKAIALKFFLKINYFYIGHTVRSLQLRKFSLKWCILKIIEYFVFNFSIKNVAICDEEYNYLLGKSSNTILIPTRFDFKGHPSLELNPWSGKKVFYNLASVDERKNPFMFIEIAKFFKENNDIVFVWYGDGPLFELIKEIIKVENLNNVFFPGKIQHNKILKLIPSFYCMLMTSKLEGVPISIIEALDLHVPVITFNYNGCSPINLIKFGFNGFIFDNVFEAIDFVKKILDFNNYSIIKNNIYSESEMRLLESENFLELFSKLLNH